MARFAGLLLAVALTGCGGAGAASPSGDEPRRYADYEGTTSPSTDQCGLPVEQRSGGWLCPETD